MTPVHTTPPQKPNPSNYAEGNIFINPVSEEAASQLDNSINNPTYSDKEETVVDTNSDSGKKPESFVNKYKKQLIGIVALIAAGFVGFSANSLLNNKEGKEDPKPTETIESTYEEEPTTNYESEIISETTAASSSEPSNITETTTQPESNPSEVATNAVEGYGFSKLSPEQQETIRKYEALSVEDFRKLPVEEQLMFSYFVFENYKPTFDIISKVQLTEEELKNIYYTENPTKPEQIVANYAYLMTMACNVYETDENDAPYKDKDLGKKLVSLAKTITDNHTTASDKLIDSSDYISFVVVYYSMPEDEFLINEKDGSYVINTIMHTTDLVIVEPSAELSQKTFIKQKFINIRGNNAEAYLASWEADPSGQTYIPLS